MFEIQHYKALDEGTIFKLKYDHESEAEFDRFALEPEHQAPPYAKQSRLITDQVYKMGMFAGFHQPSFRHEAGKHVFALPDPDSKQDLRLYCLLFEPSILILANGAIKTERRWQDDPKCAPIVKELKKVEQRILLALKALTPPLAFSQDRKGFVDPRVDSNALLTTFSL